jgi:hypothetical protein
VPFTEQTQAEIYRQRIAIIAAQAYVIGFCPWVL